MNEKKGNSNQNSNNGNSSGPSLVSEKRRESSQPKLISAETVSKNMQPNIHIQFNSIKTSTTSSSSTAATTPIPTTPTSNNTNNTGLTFPHQYFGRTWASYAAAAATANTTNNPLSPNALGGCTTTTTATMAASHYQHLASSTPKPHGLIDTMSASYHTLQPSYTYNYAVGNSSHHHHHGNNTGGDYHASASSTSNHHRHQQQQQEANKNTYLHDRSFSENTYENCHIYENSKPRSKSVETYLNSGTTGGGGSGNHGSSTRLAQNSARRGQYKKDGGGGGCSGELRACSSDNLTSKSLATVTNAAINSKKG